MSILYHYLLRFRTVNQLQLSPWSLNCPWFFHSTVHTVQYIFPTPQCIYEISRVTVFISYRLCFKQKVLDPQTQRDRRVDGLRDTGGYLCSYWLWAGGCTVHLPAVQVEVTLTTERTRDIEFWVNRNVLCSYCASLHAKTSQWRNMHSKKDSRQSHSSQLIS